MRVGFIGLGKMGNRMVMKLLSDGHEVIVWNRSKEKVDELIGQKKTGWKLESVEDYKDFSKSLEKPRVIWSMLPAGEATDAVLFSEDGVFKYLDEGDILIDGGNAKHTDTQRRFENMKVAKIRFLGIGVSGGLIAFDDGYPIMVGGDRSAYEEIKPILDSLSKPHGGHEYFGEGGAGHFVKMVHNGVEYGYMQALGEGFGVLEKSPYKLDLLKVAKLYTMGTLLSGFMMDRTVDALSEDADLSKITGEIDASGEGEWTIEEAKRNGLPITIIEESLYFRNNSKFDKNISSSFAARLVAALRKAFGGHAVKERLTTKS